MISSAPMRPADLGLLRRGHDAHGRRAAVEGELGGVGAEAAGGAPDQHGVALLHVRAVARDELAVGRGVDQPGRRGLLPGQVRGLGHQLVGLHQRQLGEAAEVGLEAPDALLGVHHRVAVAVGALQLHREAVRDHPVAGLPGVDARPGAQHDAGEVRPDDVVGQVVARGERRDAAVAAQEAERRQRLEDRRPHGVVVDRARHHRDERLARPELGRGDLVDVQALARVLLRGGDAREHVDLVGVHGDAAVVVGHRDSGERIELLGLDRVEDLLHGVGLPPRRCVVSRTLLHSMVNGTTRRNRLACDRGHRAGSVRESVNAALAAGSTSSTSTPPASFGCTKLMREPAVPRRGSG